MDVNIFRPMEMEDLPSWRSLAAKRHHQLMQFLREKSTQQASLREKLKTLSNSNLVPFNELALPDDIFLTIFLLLPAESICMLQFVCKKSFSLIQNSEFIEFQRKQSETVLISKRTYCDNGLLPLIGDIPKSYFHFVDFENGNDNFIRSEVDNLVNVLASCDGLILCSANENMSLMLINPITRKHKNLPSGTVGFRGSHGLVFCKNAKTYKVVHLFHESPNYTVCEILNINTRKWKIIDGPSSDILEDVEQMPVSVGGLLYWMPRKHGCDYFLSMDVDNEMFTSKKLPIVCTETDRLVDIGGVVGFVTHATLSLIQVWILRKGPCGGNESWVKRYSCYLGFDARLVVPICSSRNGKEMVFEYPGNDLYVHNLETDIKMKIYSRDGEEIQNRERAENIFIPHRNTLVSWDHQALS